MQYRWTGNLGGYVISGDGRNMSADDVIDRCEELEADNARLREACEEALRLFNSDEDLYSCHDMMHELETALANARGEDA